MSQDNGTDLAFCRNFVVTVAGIFVVMFLYGVIAIKIDGGMKNGRGNIVQQSAEQDLVPEAEVNIEGETPVEAVSETVSAVAEAVAPRSGEEVYNSICAACHSSKIPGIPQKGDVDAWSTRIAQGIDMLYQHSLEGFQGASGMMMPPRGGLPSLTDDEVKSAVDFMVSESQ